MRETLILRLGPTADSPAEWLLRAAPGDDTRPDEAQRGPLADALAAAAGRRLVLLVPAADVLLTSVGLAVRQAGKLAAAVPYALEDVLAEDVDHLHFALGPRQADGRTPVAVVRRSCMDGWLAPLQEAGIQPDLVIPDLLTLPPADEAPVVLLEQRQCSVRSGAFAGFVCEAPDLDTLLKLDHDEEALPPVALISVGGGDLPNEVGLARSQTVAFAIEAMRGAGEGPRLNLLQGAYAPRRETDKWLHAFRVPAALAAGWLLLATGSLALSNADMASERDRLQATAEETFRGAFPEITRIVDLRAQAELELRRLNGSGADSGFLYLLSESGKAIAAVDALSLDGLQYRDGSLYLSLSGSDLQALDVLRGKFDENAALALDVQSAQAGSDGVQIRLKVDRR